MPFIEDWITHPMTIIGRLHGKTERLLDFSWRDACRKIAEHIRAGRAQLLSIAYRQSGIVQRDSVAERSIARTSTAIRMSRSLPSYDTGHVR